MASCNDSSSSIPDDTKIETPITNEHPASPRMPKIHSQEEGTARRLNAAENLANGTVTIVIQRSKPLILKLRNPSYSLLGFGNAIMPQDDIESMISELGNELIVHITQAVNTIRDETKCARPCQGEENYEVKMVAYQELLAYITHIMNTLTKVFDHVLTEYRRRIDLLWDDIQRSQSENEVQDHVQRFLQQTAAMFHDGVTNQIEPLFKVIESKLNPAEQ